MGTTKKGRVRFRERSELLDFLLEVTSVTSTTLDLDQLLPSVADIVLRVIPHDLFAILIYSEQHKGLIIRYARGHRQEVVEKLVIPLGEGITGAAGQSQIPVLVPNVLDDKRYLSALDAVRSELAVPMIVRHKLVGVLDLQSTTANAFSPQDRALLQLIAARVGAAIDNARLYKRVLQQNRAQRTLVTLGQEFSSILDLDVLLDKIARRVHTLINYDGFSVLLVDQQAQTLRNLFSLRYDQREQMDDIPLGAGITGAAATSRQPVLARDVLADPRYISSHPGIRSEVAVPLIVKDRLLGVMDLESERLSYFTEEHVRTLGLIAPQVAISLENARLYEELAEREKRLEDDLEAAKQLQKIMIPEEAPSLPGLDAGVRMRAARAISGDLFDFFEHGDQHMIAFGDSSGKGAAAALYGALFSGLLRSLAPRRRSPAALLRSLNDVLMERNVPARFVTLFVMLWEMRTRTFTMANAGSTTPMVCRNGEIFNPSVAGVPVGLLENTEYEEKSLVAQHGDVLAIYSDGIQDQTNTDGEEYSDKRLPEILIRLADKPAQEIADLIFEDLEKFRGTIPQHDDQTLIILKVH
jgi:sigma-B regulation protein RsbU (phosphoserine phosphatase)